MSDATKVIELRFIGNSTGARKAITDLSGASGKASKQFGTHTTSIGRSFKVMMAGMVGGLAASKVFSFVREAFEAADESIAMARRTEAAIKSTGGVANVTSKQIGVLADSIMRKTGIDDEAVRSSANLLLTFTNVRNEAGKGNDIFNQATRTVQDMAVAFQTDGRSAAIQLGKALQDPIKGITALRRVGVNFTDQQKEQIRVMVESGNILGAQKIILKELAVETGGAAEAAATPWKRARAAFSEVKEEVGKALMPVLTGLANFMLTTGIPALQSMIGAIKGVVKFTSDHKTEAAVLAGGLAALLVVQKAYTAHLAIQHAGSLAAAIKNIRLVAALTRTWTAVQWLLNAALLANPIGLVIAALVALGAGLTVAWQKSETFRRIVRAAWDGVKAGADAMWGGIKAVFQFMKDGITSVWRVVQIMVLTIVRTFADMALKVVSAANSAFGWVPGLGGKLRTAENKVRAFRNNVNAQINQIKAGKTVTITATVNDKYIASRLSVYNQQVPKHARGGAIYGPGTGTSDSVPALLSTGEHVWTAREVAAAGGHRAVELIRAAVRNGFGFATGGGVDWRANMPSGPRTAGVFNRLEGYINLGANALASAMAKALTRALQASMVIPSGNIGGSGVRRWAPLVLRALRELGQSSALLPAVLRRMNQESGGNPRAINLWDSNARRGTPSKGLMQTIQPTFNRWAGPYRSLGIWNPYANIYAGLNYALHRYRSLAYAMNKPGGYDNGGWLMPGWTMAYNGTGKPERVVAPHQEQGKTEIHIHNPKPEPASASLRQVLRERAYLAGGGIA